MGWRQLAAGDERLRFIEECKSREWSIAEVCRRFEISRKTGYKWLDRYESGGMDALKDRTHAAHRNPRQVPEQVEDAIVGARGKHPHWGPARLRAWLHKTAPEIQWPALSTIGEVLRRHGLAVPREKRQKTISSNQPLQHSREPNLVWCADFKGSFRCQDGSRSHLLTIADSNSHFLLKCQAAKHADTLYTKSLFEAAFREYGLPESIRIHNSAPFAAVGIGGLSELSVWWIKLGIRLETVEPGEPGQDGFHERMHRTLRQETARPPRANLREQQKAFDAFRQEHNHGRPQEDLEGKTPAECYRDSLRPYRSRIHPPEYPAGFEVRQVDEAGQILWNRASIFVGPALSGEPIGLEYTGNGEWPVWFSFYELGVFDEDGLLIRTRPSTPQTSKS
jgi:transposase InsO family protein